MLTLYHADHSVCAQKVRIALAEKGLDWESRLLDLQANDQHTPQYLALNPGALVPTLVHDGKVLTESNVIDEYLDDAFPDPPLRPDTPALRARMRLWTKRLDEGLHAATGVVSHAIVFRHIRLAEKPWTEVEADLNRIPDPLRRARQIDTTKNGVESSYFAAAIRQFETLFDDMERALGGTRWLAGDSFSLADIAYVPYLVRMANMGFLGMLEARPRVADWYARATARPSYAIAIAKWHNPKKLALMRDKGAEAWPKAQAAIAG